MSFSRWLTGFLFSAGLQTGKQLRPICHAGDQELSDTSWSHLLSCVEDFPKNHIGFLLTRSGMGFRDATLWPASKGRSGEIPSCRAWINTDSLCNGLVFIDTAIFFSEIRDIISKRVRNFHYPFIGHHRFHAAAARLFWTHGEKKNQLPDTRLTPRPAITKDM